MENHPNIRKISNSVIRKYLSNSAFKVQKAEECVCSHCLNGHEAFEDLQDVAIKLEQYAQDNLTREEYERCREEFQSIIRRKNALYQYLLRGPGFTYGLRSQNVNPAQCIQCFFSLQCLAIVPPLQVFQLTNHIEDTI